MAKILVIDDDPDILMAVRMSLTDAGYQVEEATSGETGLQKIQSAPPDLIILDVMMETRTKGFEIAKKLRKPEPGLEAFREIPILMLTSIHTLSRLSEEAEIADLPVDLYVDKPIDPHDLVKKVEWVLSRQPA